MTYEKGLFAQADPGIVSGSTIERKKMSTKTIYKRIALVAVTALGAGVLSVAPANAADVTIAYTVTATAPSVNTTSTTASAAGAEVTATISAAITGTTATSVTPVVATFKLLDPNGADVTTTATFTAAGNAGDITANSVTGAAVSASFAAKASAAGNIATIKFTPTLGGLYTMTVSNPTGVGADNNIGARTNVAVSGSMHISGINVSQGTTRGLTGAAVAGNQAQVSVLLPAQTAAQTYKFASTGVGAIIGATPTNGANANLSGVTTDFSRGTVMTSTANTTLTQQLLTLGSAAEGVQTITVSTVDATTGVASSLYTATVTWGVATSADLTTIAAYTLTTGTACANTTAASTQASMASTLASANALTLCIVLKNGAGTAYTRSTSISVVGNGIGQIAAATTNVGSAVIADGAVTAGNKQFVVFGNGLPGTATYTITASSTGVDGVTTVTKTTTASVIANGTFTAIALANLKKSIALSTAEAGTLAFSGTDSASKAAVVDLSTGATWYVESDKGTTAVSATAPNNSSATVTQGTVDTITAATGASTADGRITVTSGAAYEKLTIWVTKKNASGTTITSNKVVVFVSTAKTAAKTVTVTTAPATTGGLTVTVTALSDPAVTTTAYPVVDGAAITLGASAGTLSATALTTGATGNATATFYPSQLGGSMILTAVATDPAVDPVGSVTVAAGDSVLTALTTLVNSLIAKINALNKLVIKIQKKVRA
jgi:hypothetical protein